MFVQSIKQFYKGNERIMVPIMLVVGVIADFITFRTIKIESAFVILIIYWLFSGASIGFLHHRRSGGLVNDNKLIIFYNALAPLVIQFTFGALLSASLVFYWFSGALSISWPFIFLIAVLMIANEAFREQYMRPVVQLGVYYFATFSLLTLMLPYLFNSISGWIFVFAGVVSLLVMFLYVFFLLYRYAHIQERMKRVVIVTLGLYALMNILYFTNLIPPIPLSLMDAGIYHSMIKVSGNYIVQAETENLFERIIPGQTLHVVPQDSLFVFSSVFAPFDLETTIEHEWQYFDGAKKKWITSDRLSFFVSGGRENGYRGYSKKANLSAGLWRVNVQTERGQVIGRVRFHVKTVEDEVDVIELQK